MYITGASRRAADAVIVSVLRGLVVVNDRSGVGDVVRIPRERRSAINFSDAVLLVRVTPRSVACELGQFRIAIRKSGKFSA